MSAAQNLAHLGAVSSDQNKKNKTTKKCLVLRIAKHYVVLNTCIFSRLSLTSQTIPDCCDSSFALWTVFCPPP